MILTIKELALYLGVSQSLIRTQVRKNKIPYFRLGNRILFYEDDIVKFIRTQYPNNEYGKA